MLQDSQKMLYKKGEDMKRCLVFWLGIILLLSMAACGDTPTTWQEQYDLGVRYLSEGNYEEAIIAFTAAIEVDPKQPDAYLKAAEAYRAIGDDDEALLILEQGLENTEDKAILEMLSALSIETNRLSQHFTENMISFEEFTIGGVPFYESNLEQVSAYFSQVDPGQDCHVITITDVEGNIFEHEVSFIQDNCMVVSCSQRNGISHLTSLQYSDLYHEKFLCVRSEVREITTGDYMHSVLEKLGFDSVGAEIMEKSGCGFSVGLDRELEGGYGWVEKIEDSGSYFGRKTESVVLLFGAGQAQFDFVNNRLAGIAINYNV